MKPLMNTCDVCGKANVPCYVVCGNFGSISYAICEDCLAQGKEPYNQMVLYIAIAGRYPEDINPRYVELVRQQLKLHNISEETFQNDVDSMIKSMENDE